ASRAARWARPPRPGLVTVAVWVMSHPSLPFESGTAVAETQPRLDQLPSTSLGGPHTGSRTLTWRPNGKSPRHLFVPLLVGAVAPCVVRGSKEGTSATSPIDLSPPQAPTNFHSTTDATISRDWLVWDQSASANVSGYQIYSAPSPTGSGTLIATVDAGSTDYLLPIVNDSSTEFYRVRAMGTNNVPSAFTSTLGVERSGW